MLTHNAPEYVRESIETLQNITAKSELQNLELIVWDNSSNEETVNLLKELKAQNKIDKLHFSDINYFFSKGNNLAVKLADEKTDCYLLLNSDVSIKNSKWLKKLVNYKIKGNFAGVSYGVANYPGRCDGYCFLIEKKLYDKYQLDENYEWWWGLTKFQADILHDGHNLLALDYHDGEIVHYGGKSGVDFQKAKGLDTDYKDILSWFSNSQGKVKIKKHSIVKFFLNKKNRLYKRLVKQ